MFEFDNNIGYKRPRSNETRFNNYLRGPRRLTEADIGEDDSEDELCDILSNASVSKPVKRKFAQMINEGGELCPDDIYNQPYRVKYDEGNDQIMDESGELTNKTHDRKYYIQMIKKFFQEIRALLPPQTQNQQCTAIVLYNKNQQPIGPKIYTKWVTSIVEIEDHDQDQQGQNNEGNGNRMIIDKENEGPDENDQQEDQRFIRKNNTSRMDKDD
ncbi:MAG: hypothetical protein EZS28_037580 [Streblomastix strix]|uniref:Uncharacterized protein n=1 Tax=Streblomastix strix TaxID=222440 RepID=A0A5J4U9J7_9EUKA|nr:MAG: hypothetical protein EZS28_037580 [Streblomastix strix]